MKTYSKGAFPVLKGVYEPSHVFFNEVRWCKLAAFLFSSFFLHNIESDHLHLSKLNTLFFVTVK